MKEIKDADGTSDKVSSVRNSSQQAVNPGDFSLRPVFPPFSFTSQPSSMPTSVPQKESISWSGPQ